MNPPNHVLEYITSSGRNPYREWLVKIRDRIAVGIILGRISRLALGHLGDAKAVGAGVLELRIHYGSGYRIYFAWDQDRAILLLAGGEKKTQPMDIKRAQAYWRDYQRRTE